MYGRNGFYQASANSRAGQDYGAYVPNMADWNHVNHLLPRPAPPRSRPGATRAVQDSWWSYEDRIPPEPYGFMSFPAPPPPPGYMRYLVLDNDIARDVNSRPRQPIPEPPATARLINQQNAQVPAEEDSKLTQDEQKAALQKLNKKIYNPTPKKMASRLNSFYRQNSRNNSGENGKDYKGKNDDDEDGRNCAICLEDFEPREVTMVTPCDHMFHEECIVPWVKSHGQCPVCRFAICERMKENPAPINNNNATATANVIAVDPVENDLISIIRTMENFEWGNGRVLQLH